MDPELTADELRVSDPRKAEDKPAINLAQTEELTKSAPTPLQREHPWTIDGEVSAVSALMPKNRQGLRV